MIYGQNFKPVVSVTYFGLCPIHVVHNLSKIEDSQFTNNLCHHFSQANLLYVKAY